MGFYQPVYSQDNIENGHEWVDLGLSVKWATCNVGASVPEQYGNYYAWGETKPKDEYTQSNSVTLEQNISDFSGNPQYDAATANWGGDWRMPTEAEMNELESKCTWEWIKQNGVRGYKVTGPNGNFIFLPAAGRWSHTSFTDGSCGYTYYWSSTPVSSTSSHTVFLEFDSGSHGVFNGNFRYYGCSVRAVREWKDGETPSVGVSVNSTDITAVVNTYVSSPISEITARGFYWGTNPNPTEADNNVVLENTTGSIAKAITNLTPNTTYYVKAYATNSSGTSYSEVISFTTLDKVEYDYVDLGLPSKLKWATYNVGASFPEECGNYYAWGEVTPKTEYTQSNSETYGMLMNDISGNPQYDAAAANWGGGWRMPTNTEMQELIDYCTWEWTTQNGVNGYKAKSKTNDNSIFIPAKGYRQGSETYDIGTGYYWNSIPKDDNAGSYYMYFGSRVPHVSSGNRYYGRTIRPVKDSGDEEAPSISVTINNTDITAIVDTYVSSSTEITARGFYWGTNPNPTEADNNVVLENALGDIKQVLVDLTPNTTYYVKAYATNSYGTSYSEVVSFTTLAESAFTDYVDLGLPSGLKWATYNVGASTPEEYGNYYAWGEIVTKNIYTEENSVTYGESMSDISGNVQYDAATANWGGDWRMPTEAEMHELVNECTWTWLLQNGTKGYKVTGPNGSSIFLPAAGYYQSWSLTNAGGGGYYWSSAPYGSTNAYGLNFNSDGHRVYYDYRRYYGCPVRPVRE